MWETSERKSSDDGEGEQRCKALQYVWSKTWNAGEKEDAW